MSDYTGGRNIAEYDWCWLFASSCTGACETRPHYECNCIDDQLHAPDPALVTAFDDWDGDSIDCITACGRSGLMTIPGVGSRMGDTRCSKCCDVVGLPQGVGSPKNDQACRDLLGMLPSPSSEELLRAAGKREDTGGVVGKHQQENQP